MRISTSQLYQRGVDSILEQQSVLSRTQQQVATGKKLLSPADDPPAVSRLVELNTELRNNEQYATNIDHVESRLSYEEEVIDGVTNQLQRLRELAVQANSGSLGADNRLAISYEAREILSSVLALSNTQDANGEYLFSGYQGGTEPFSHDGLGTFTYNGDQGRRSVNINSNTSITISDNGNDVFMNIPTTGGVQDMFSTIYGFITDLEANTPSSQVLGELDEAMEKLLTVRGSIGARLNSVDEQRSMNESFRLQISKNISVLQDLDYAEAISRLSQQLAGLEASQQAFVRIQNLSLFNNL